MDDTRLDLRIAKLGACRVASPIMGERFVSDDDRILYHSHAGYVENALQAGKKLPSFELAGPRKTIYFDPSKLKCGIVTCGGLCPGLNDVIRAIVLGLYHHYGVQTVFGYRYGFEGLSAQHRHAPLELTPLMVNDIHQKGGTILGSSRGPQDIAEMVDTLEHMNVRVLFAVGGDGTLKGAQAIAGEIAHRGLNIAVVGIPKTIDNDISCIDRSFGFETAVSEATTAIYSAHAEAEGARNGIGLVKLMGRDSGFIAAHAALANADVNFCLVPEVPFALETLLEALEKRLKKRKHAVIVVGEGAGQDLMQRSDQRDPSGNIRLKDIGLFLRDRMREHFGEIGMEVSVRYIDPSYTIRSQPAIAHDSWFCLLLGQHAVHAAMTGRTSMVMGFWKDEFTHVPITAAVAARKRIDPEGRLWSNVLASTGQPRELG